MEITGFGLLVIPVSFLLLPLHPAWLLAWTIVLAPFEAASVLNLELGGYRIGLQPGYFAAVLFLAAFVLRTWRDGRTRIPAELQRAFVPLVVFGAYVTVSAVVLPEIFARHVDVFPPREGLALSSLSPLEPSGTNLTQTLYVAFLTVFTIGASLIVREVPDPRVLLRAYVVTALVIVTLGVYQLMAYYGGFSYPEDFLYSNPVYYQGFQQRLGSIKRMSSAFTEPSALAHYLAGVFGYAVARFLSADRWLPATVIAYVMLAGLVLSTSTTAYVTVAAVLVLAVMLARPQRRVPRLALFMVGAALSLGVIQSWLVAQTGPEALTELAFVTLIDKTNSSSFVNRVGADLHSLALVSQTFGLGVGWGSNRASSLVTTLLSTAGLFGAALLLWFGWRMARLTRHMRDAHGPDAPGIRYIVPLTMSIIAMLIAGAIAIPDLNHLTLWLNVALLAGLAVRRAAPAEIPRHGPEPAAERLRT